VSGVEITLVLLGAVAHALWNLASKYKRGDTVVFVWVYTAASAVVCLPIAVTLVVRGVQQFTWALVVGAAVSAVLHVVYSLVLQTGYDHAELGVVYPVARGTGPVLSMIVAVVILREQVSVLALVGALIVIVGIVVVAGNPFARRGGTRSGGMAWGVATGATIACYTLWDSFSVATMGLDPITYFAGTLVLETALLAPGVGFRRGADSGGRPTFGEVLRESVKNNWIPLLTVAILSPTAYILVLHVMQHAPVALVAPLRESSVVIGSLLGWWLFHEGNLLRRLGGGVVVLAGIVAISA
jgi:drug/metabolite transporter (DMT)-like permease